MTLDDGTLREAKELARAIYAEVGHGYIGPDTTAAVLLTALVAEGHVLLEGVPGVAKTTLVKTFAATLGCAFRRIQFTPDLLPSDITGTNVLDMKTSDFVLRGGPIFAHVVLGDEINRAPAKTQSALLEAMQEKQVTIDGETHPLGAPFLVLATQNPLEQEGTYPLPEAQVDRFLFKVIMGYPTLGDEKRMLAGFHQGLPEVRPVTDPGRIRALQQMATSVHVEEDIVDYILALARFTREHPRVYLGASPRAALSLMRAAQAWALLGGRGFVLPDDIKDLARFVFAHRLVLSPEAELEGVEAATIVDEALGTTAHRPRS